MENTILLVDDEVGIRSVLSISLRDAGYNVHAAEDGNEALRIFEAFGPAIVLTDIRMPGMNGIELLRRIKQKRPETEVIMITGHGDLDLAIQSMKHDASDFITKPINNDILEIALKRARERIHLREQLREYTLNLEQMVHEKTQKLLEAERLAAVGHTVAGLSHAIKNIAGGLKGGVFILEKGLELDDQKYLKQGWEMVRGNIDKITKLSLDLLDYSKTGEINCRLCDPNQPVHEVVDLMKFRAKENEIDLQAEVCPDLEAFRFDPELIHRCLLNLVSNAIDTCKDHTPCENQKTVTVKSLRIKGWGVEYQVMDNCGGMEEDVKGKVFNGFFSTKGTGGTGIGLMLTKKIIDDHGGVVAVESQPGVGSAFTIRLPLRS